MRSEDVFPNERLENEIICRNYQNLDARYKTDNNDTYRERMFVPQYYKCSMEIKDNNKLRWPQDNRLCDMDVIFYRGQNNRPPQNFDMKKNEFLLKYCNCNTYDNGLICDEKKCCSKSHQLFCNMTKRNGQRLCNEYLGIANPRRSCQ
jgi:hypothetical protein